MRRIHHLTCALLALSWTAPLVAQQPTHTIRGRITDNSTQQPIVGVVVTVGGRSAITQSDGRYTITGVPGGSDLLHARLIGYQPANQPVMVAGDETVVVDVALTPSAVGLSAVVVTGYGVQRVGDITGSVTAVSDSQFNTGRVVSPQMLIQSKVAGVQVVDNNDPGGGLSLRIRGPTSVTASSEPLYVVDGVPLGTGSGGGLSAGRDPLNFLNPNDIQDMTVLRDASAAAIYGTNAANGVVLIQTKAGRGTQGSQFEYNSSASASSVTRLPDMLSSSQFAAAVAQYAPGRVDSLRGVNTDWFSKIDRTAYGQEHNFSFTNGGADNSYRLSVGYLKQDGVIRASSVDRVSLGFNYRQNLSDRLNLRTGIRGSRTLDRFTPGDVLGNAAAMAPTQPVLDPTSATGYWDWRTTNAAPTNPLSILALASDRGTTWRSVGNASAEYKLPFLQGLTGNLNVGYDLTKADRTTFYSSTIASQVRQGQGSFSLQNNSQGTSVLETYLGYAPAQEAGPGRINAVAGYSFTQSHAEYPRLDETGLSSNLLGPNGIPTAVNVRSTLFINDYKLISFFGRLNYNINDKYLAGLSLRRDGSSRFGPGNQWGTFPSVAVAWRLSQEPFMQGRWGLSDLKLRASWARTGNQSFGDYLAYSTYTYSDAQTQVQFGNTFTPTIRPSAVDENIHWEKTSAYNVGLDFGFSNQRYSGTIDWYTKNTSDLIFFIPIAAGTNLGNFITTNIGSMKNKGYELSLNADVLPRSRTGFSWTATITAAHNTNQLLSINPNKSVTRVLTGNISGGVGNFVQELEPGVPVNSFWVYQQKYGANGKPIYSDTLTNMYVDRNGDGVINDSDRRPFHDPAPKWILGHSSYFTYKHFDGSFTLRAYLGNWVYNNVASSQGAYQNLTGSAMPSNLHRSVLTTGFIVPQYYSDYFVEDASFIRMDNITLAYGFTYRDQPLRLFGTVQNAFTLTGYTGVDPTSGLNGIDNNIYPRSRTFTTGLSVRF
ncbi:MAG TPA: SusC/RagA family TonB-linked outer membrane protein [Gemmatimonadales bacterium]|nr:SusC/RagA family TonB-linked outer membrane protein [Gemmatimonadales bacterium]